jgi:hypothetical protein
MARHRRNRNRPDATGRNPYQRHIQLTHRLLESPAYRSLSPTARALLVELTMLYKGDNNGSLYLSVRHAAARLGLGSLKSAQDALDELQALSFIEMVQDAHFEVKAAEHSRARTWRLTWLAGPGKRMPDLELYERQPRPQTRARQRMERGLRALKAFRKGKDNGRFPVSDSETLTAANPIPFIKPVSKSMTASTENCAFPANDRVSDSATHIDHHGCLTDAIDLHPGFHLTAWWEPHLAHPRAHLAQAAILAALLRQATGEKRLVA